MEKTILMRYTGKSPVKIPGVCGYIKTGETFDVPIEIANNLARDPNYEKVSDRKNTKKTTVEIRVNPRKSAAEKKEVKDE